MTGVGVRGQNIQDTDLSKILCWWG